MIGLYEGCKMKHTIYFKGFVIIQRKVSDLIVYCSNHAQPHTINFKRTTKMTPFLPEKEIIFRKTPGKLLMKRHVLFELKGRVHDLGQNLFLNFYCLRCLCNVFLMINQN